MTYSETKAAPSSCSTGPQPQPVPLGGSTEPISGPLAIQEGKAGLKKQEEAGSTSTTSAARPSGKPSPSGPPTQILKREIKAAIEGQPSAKTNGEKPLERAKRNDAKSPQKPTKSRLTEFANTFTKKVGKKYMDGLDADSIQLLKKVSKPHSPTSMNGVRYMNAHSVDIMRSGVGQVPRCSVLL